jgi:hypothetical protein
MMGVDNAVTLTPCRNLRDVLVVVVVVLVRGRVGGLLAVRLRTCGRDQPRGCLFRCQLTTKHTSASNVGLIHRFTSITRQRRIDVQVKCFFGIVSNYPSFQLTK